ncbi:peptidoglycan DD-metalloendopeptidase family protein [Alphaproteobacteria bacterium LSUCC0684]
MWHLRLFLISVLLLSGCAGLNTERALLPVKDAPKRQNQQEVPPDGIIRVEPGDTIYTIANRYGVTPRRIILANNLAPPYELTGLDTLEVPKPRSHIIAAGDTLQKISKRYSVSVSDIIRLNGLEEPYSLRQGMAVAIPRRLDYSLLDLPVDQSTPETITPAENIAVNPVPKSVGQRVAFTSGGTFSWPVDGTIIETFGETARGVHNDGVNIGAETGSAVRAAQKGQVAFVGAGLKSFGNLVLVKHDGGWITAYAHLGSIEVEEGQRLDQGDVIGTVGMTGRVDSPQLHFELRKARKPVNPQDYLT